MSANLATVLRLGDAWLRLADGALETLAEYPTLGEPARVIDDLSGAVSGLATLDGKAEHTASLIERQVRRDGLVDGESHVVVHRLIRAPGGVQALYTAVPTEAWQRLLGWAERQKNHCLVTPLLSLACRSLRPGTALVLRAGARLVFLSQTGDRLRHAEVMAYSEQEDDLCVAARSLGERAAVRGRAPEAAQVQWLPLLSGGVDERRVAADFERAAAISVSLVSLTPLRGPNGQEMSSALPALAARWSTADAVNTAGSRALYAADRAMPIAAAASATVAAGLLAVAVGLFAQAGTLSAQANTLLAAATARRDAATAAAAQPLPAAYPAMKEFAARLANIEAELNPHRLLSLLGKLAGQDIRVLRVRLERIPGKASAVLIDAALEPGSGKEAALARFATELRQAGFDVKPANAGDGKLPGYFGYRLTRRLDT